MNGSGDINLDRYQNRVEQERANKLLDFNSNDKGYSENRDARNFLLGLDDILKSVNKELGQLSSNGKEATKDYKNLAEGFRQLTDISKKLNSGTLDSKKASDTIKQFDKTINKISEVANKDVKKNIDKMYDVCRLMIDTGLDFSEIMKKSSEDFKTAVSNAASQLRRDVVQIWQAMNVEKILTGGGSISDMRTAQANVKSTLGFNDKEFVGFQRDIFDQTMQINDTLGMSVTSMTDVANYMRSIKELNLRNNTWAEKQYKAVTISNKYLGLSNTTMSKMLGVASAINDEQYAMRQASILAALSADNTTAENIEDVAGWWNEQALSSYARFNNSDMLGAQTQAILSSSRANLGGGSEAFERILADFYSGDYVTFMDKYASLVSADRSGALNQLIRSAYETGNADITGISEGLLEAIQTRYNEAGSLGSTFFNQLGLDTNLYNTGYAYTKNEENLLGDINKSILAMNTDTTKNLKDLDTTTWWETFTNDFKNMAGDVANFFGLNWKDMLSIAQVVKSIGALAVFGSTIAQTAIQTKILWQLRANQLANAADLDIPGGSGILSTLKAGLSAGGISAGGATSAVAATAGVLGIAGGAYMGYKDYKKNGWKGAFLGNADFNDKNKSGWDNTKDVLGNTAKYAAIGAGVGSFIPGLGTLAGAGIGALVGLGTGLVGGLVGNKETEENTETTAQGVGELLDVTSDGVSWQRRSALALEGIESDMIHGSKGFGSGTGGVGGSGDYLASRDKGTGYPWTVGSGYGKRHKYVNGKETNEWGWHNGFDLWKYTGAPLGANVDGVVTYKWKSNGSKVGYGNGLQIQGSDGKFYEYGHMLNPSPLEVGDTVQAGDTVGFMGSTGNSTGTHLHFTVRNKNGEDIYPADYIYAGLFSASGDVYDRKENKNTESTDDTGLQYYLRKDQNVESSGAGMGEDYAKSSDFDRLIDTLTSMNASKTEKQDFMRALAGKNAMIGGR